MAQGAGQAVAENKVADKIKLVGFDSDDKLIKLLTDGTIVALVVQDPYRMGYDGIKTALAASKGDKVETFVDTGANLITKENMNSPRSQELLNPESEVILRRARRCRILCESESENGSRGCSSLTNETIAVKTSPFFFLLVRRPPKSRIRERPR